MSSQPNPKTAFFWPLAVLVALLALAAIASRVFDAWNLLMASDAVLFLASSALYLASIHFWIISWSYLVRKRFNVPHSMVLKSGWSSVYGALTPLQLGSEALRSVQLKRWGNVPLQQSISSSVVVKSFKFLVIALASLMGVAWLLWRHAYVDQALLLLLQGSVDWSLFLPLLGGFAVIALFSAMFLLPFRRTGFGQWISRLEKANRFFPVQRLTDFLKTYERHARQSSHGTLCVVFFLSAASWLMELAALHFAFQSIQLSIEFDSLFLLAVMVSVLERFPLLPRGVGLVELASYQFLSYVPSASILPEQIVAVLLLFGLVRLAVPTLLSLLLSAYWNATESNLSKKP